MRLLIIVCLIMCGGNLSAQVHMQTNLESYLPPSPTAQEFIKYGEYPVSLYTGVPSISIPIYEIEVKDFKLPITLSYHSSGIQVDQEATWVGLGWSLNAGGMITRVPRGSPDDGGFLSYEVYELKDLKYNDNYYEQAATGFKDTESDIYYYNFGDYSGEFFFGRDKKVRLIKEAPIEISYTQGTFRIIVEDGSIFEFNANSTEHSTSSTYSFGSANMIDYVSTWHLTKITSNHQSEIITFSYENEAFTSSNQYVYTESTGNSIVLTFPPSIINGIHEGPSLASQVNTINSPKRLREINFPNGKIIFNRANDRLDGVHDRLNEIIIYQKDVRSVLSVVNSFVFVADHFYSSQTLVASQAPLRGPTDQRRYRLKLKELVKYDQNRNNPLKYTFEYNNIMLPPLETNAKDFWGYYNGKYNGNLIPIQPDLYTGQQVGIADRNPDANFMKAGVLEKITYPTGGYTEFYYQPHEYVSSEPSLITTSKYVSSRGDVSPYNMEILFTPTYSGYATIKVESSDMIDAEGGLFPRILLQKVGDSNSLINHAIDPYTYTFPFPPTQSEIQKTFPNVYLIKGQSYILKVEVKGNSSSNLFNGAAFINGEITYQDLSQVQNIVTKVAGGLRVSEIKSYTEDNIFGFGKKYNYSNSRLVTPEQFLKEQFLDVDIEGWALKGNTLRGGGIGGCANISTKRRYYYGGTVRSLTLYGGSPVVYGIVDEIQINNVGQEMGKTRYHFSTHEDLVFQTFTSYQAGLMLLKMDWTGGQVYLKEIYENKPGKGPSLIYTEKNDYITKRDGLSIFGNAYKMYKIVHSKRIFGNCRIISPGQFEIIEYPLFSGVKLLKKTQTFAKDNLGLELYTTKDIYYENDLHLQPTREEVNSSEGDPVIIKKYFPDDINSKDFLGAPTLTTDELNAIIKLKVKNQHRIEEPVQIEQWQGNNKIFMQRISYKEWENGLVLPEVIKSSYENNLLENRIRYHSYDKNANPTMISKENGPIISYIWGYNGQYPIAKIENSSYSEIASKLGITLNALEGFTESDLSKINGLRAKLPQSLISTFTFNPLIGMTSQTDPNGLTTFYEYDDFGRLMLIKDKDGNVLETFEYNYAGPQ